MRMTREQLRDYEIRRAQQSKKGKTLCEVFCEEEAVKAGEEKSQLHVKILKYLHENGYAYIHSPSIMKSTQTPGSPDFTIAADHGRTIYCECKTSVGKLDPDQVIWHHLANNKGHRVWIIRSMTAFHKLMADTQKQ